MTTCPRCGGRLFPESNRYGAYLSCYACGYIDKRPEKQAAPEVRPWLHQAHHEEGGLNTPHTELCLQIEELLCILGAYEVRLRGGFGQRRGLPDIIACFRGHFVAIEVKTGRSFLSAAQVRQGENITVAEGIYIVARCLEDVMEGLRIIEPNVTSRARVL